MATWIRRLKARHEERYSSHRVGRSIVVWVGVGGEELRGGASSGTPKKRAAPSGVVVSFQQPSSPAPRRHHAGDLFLAAGDDLLRAPRCGHCQISRTSSLPASKCQSLCDPTGHLMRILWIPIKAKRAGAPVLCACLWKCIQCTEDSLLLHGMVDSCLESSTIRQKGPRSTLPGAHWLAGAVPACKELVS
jgi:hypothetical protein